MKFTLSWLKDHLETTAALDELLIALTNLGLEVESVDNPAARLKGFVVADVVTCERHPNADRLSKCQVNDGSGTLIQVVCGAPNVRAGMKTAFARVGQLIPATNEFLKKGRIRDVDSYGMLCSASELLLEKESEGILDLDTQVAAGSPLAEALNLNDPIIELAITPNRSDCFGVRGIARDLAAAGHGQLKPWPYQQPKTQSMPVIQIEIHDHTACPYFVGQFIKGIKNGPSPAWAQRRLEAIGLRPISALVDITNYLTHDIGRPLHVFDAARIQGNLTIRMAKAGETLEALNDKTYKLDDQMIVVADESGALSLGGIIGGKSTGCSNTTTDILIECALFDPIRIATTGRTLNVLSDARTRLERGVDPAAIRDGIRAAADLILQWCGGEASELMIAGAEPTWQRTIHLTLEKLVGLSGCSLTLDEAADALRSLGFEVRQQTKTDLIVQPPSWRPDIEGSADLVEEILRLKGYDKIPAVPMEIPALIPLNDLATDAKRLMATRGLYEVVTWSFIPESLAIDFGGGSENLRLANPISQDHAVMRPSILAPLMLAVESNEARGQESFALFEVGPHYEADRQQRLVTAGVRVGQAPRHWAKSAHIVDVFDAKADVEALLDLYASNGQLEDKAPDYYHPGRCGTIRQGPKVLAQFGEIHPRILMALGLKGPIVAFEVFLDIMPPPKLRKSTPVVLSPYPSVTRDFAFVVDRSTPVEKVLKAIQKADRDLIESMNVFDVYEGDKIPINKKSIAIEVRLQPRQTTLTEAEITAFSDKVVSAVNQTTGGELRS